MEGKEVGGVSASAPNPSIGLSAPAPAPPNIGGNVDSNFEDSSQLEEVLQVPLLAERILSFLSLRDLKVLSEMSWTALKAIRASQHFSRLARLHISKEVLETCVLSNLIRAYSSKTIVVRGELQQVDCIWNSLSLELTPNMCEEVWTALEEVLEGVESLNLYLGSGVKAGKIYPCLERILKRGRELKALGLEAKILIGKSEADYLSIDEIREVFGRLHSLELHGGRNKGQLEGQRYFIGRKGSILFQRKMEQLSKLPLKLKRFVFGEQIAYSGLGLIKSIPAIIRSNRMTLEELELPGNLWELAELAGIHCPNLKRLKASAAAYLDYPAQANVLEGFLSNNLSSALMLEMEVLMMWNSSILALGWLLEKGGVGNMTSLHLKTLSFPDPNWGFLEGMTRLKDFSLEVVDWDENQRNGLEGSGEEILSRLPPTIQKFSLRNVKGFWSNRYEPNIGRLLGRFPNLQKLNLVGCTNAISNDGLQSLIVHCPQLRSLSFSDCALLRDQGLVGAPAPFYRQLDRTGISLDQLTGLVHLEIGNCPFITNEGMLRVMKFRYLRSFHYQSSDEVYNHVSKDFLLQIVRQNPSLESLRMAPFNPEQLREGPLRELKQEVKGINPFLRTLELK